MNEFYISLDEQDFRCLIRGGILQIIDKKNNSRCMISLKDIGFYTMYKALEDVGEGKEEIYKNLER
jgi:hypothetical protein